MVMSRHASKRTGKPIPRSTRQAKTKLQAPSKLVHEERGQALVEFAITAPILLLFLAGIINFGLILFTYLNMTITVQEASRLAGLGQSDCTVGQYISSHVTVQGADKLTLTSCPAFNTAPDSHSLVVSLSPIDSSRAPGTYVTVTLHYSMSNLVPVFNQFLSPISLSTTSTVRVE